MPARHVTRRYDALHEFIGDYRSTIAKGGIFIDRHHLGDDEPAKEIKLDLNIPDYGTIGPLTAQLVHQDPEGGWGFRIPEIPADIQQELDRLMVVFESVRTYLVEGGKFVPADQAPKAAPAATLPWHTRKRGFVLPDVTGHEAALEGSLDDESFRDAIVQMALMRATGLMVVEVDDIVRYGFWREGGPVGWRSEPLQRDEVMGMLLVRGGQITMEQLKSSLELMQESPLRQGEALMMLGVLQLTDVLAILGKQVDHVLSKVMQAKSGTWRFYPLPGLTERFVVAPLKVLPRIFRGLSEVAEQMNPAEFRQIVDDNMARWIVIREDAIEHRKEFDFSPEEEKVLEVLATGPTRLRDLAKSSPLGKKGSMVMLWALEDLGVVEFRDEEGTSEALERLEQKIEAKKAQIAEGNPFAILDIHWSATGDELKVAFKKAIAAYSPDMKGLGKLKGELAVVCEGIEKAYGEVRTDQRRREVRGELVDPGRIENSAELLARKGEIALQRKDARGALICYQKAIELVPDDDRFHQGLAQAKKLARGR